MLTEKELSPLNSIKKEAGTGSYQGMRWRIEKDGDDQMKVTIYPEPKSFACTPEEQKTSVQFPLPKEGRTQAAAWLWEQYEAQEERWKSAPRI